MVNAANRCHTDAQPKRPHAAQLGRAPHGTRAQSPHNRSHNALTDNHSPDGAHAAEQTLAATANQVAAAVLVSLFLAGDGDEPHLVLTRRRADLRRHAGEISFPGGRRDPDDLDLCATALREAEEEIGLARTEVRVLGELSPISTFVTGYLIHPFVGLIPGGCHWRPSPREVDAVLELPLGALRASRTRTQIERRGISFETDAYILAEHLIWGATARILDELYERLDELLPAAPGARAGP